MGAFQCLDAKRLVSSNSNEAFTGTENGAPNLLLARSAFYVSLTTIEPKGRNSQMKEMSPTIDVVSSSEFRTELSRWLRKVKKTGQPLMITQNKRPAGVLVSPETFDELRHTKLFIDSVRRGLRDAKLGRVFRGMQLKQELKKRRRKKITP